MKKLKSVLLLLLAAALCFAFAGCGGTDDEEDPQGQDAVIDISANEAINTFLNQYNLDAEYRVSNEDCSEVTSTSADVRITDDLLMRVSSIAGPVTVMLEFSDLDDEVVEAVTRDAIIALSPNSLYDDVTAMVEQFRNEPDQYVNDYMIDEVRCSFMRGDGGMYQIGIYEPM